MRRPSRRCAACWLVLVLAAAPLLVVVAQDVGQLPQEEQAGVGVQRLPAPLTANLPMNGASLGGAAATAEIDWQTVRGKDVQGTRFAVCGTLAQKAYPR